MAFFSAIIVDQQYRVSAFLSPASSQLILPLPALVPGQVALWVINYAQTSDKEAARLRALLSQEELERNGNLRQPGHRKCDAVCRGTLRKLLSHYLDIPNDKLELSRGEHGKPLISSPHSDLQFNYSHSGDCAAIALCHGPSVGVDIEYCQRNNDLAAISQRFFAASEIAALGDLPRAQQRRRFFQYWTLKEAYIKARGEGIFLGLGNFSFELDDTVPELIGISFISEQFDNPERWQFLQYQPLEDYLVSVAIEAASPVYSLRHC